LTVTQTPLVTLPLIPAALTAQSILYVPVAFGAVHAKFEPEPLVVPLAALQVYVSAALFGAVATHTMFDTPALATTWSAVRLVIIGRVVTTTDTLCCAGAPPLPSVTPQPIEYVPVLTGEVHVTFAPLPVIVLPIAQLQL
jgi:hypothetical protein